MGYQPKIEAPDKANLVTCRSLQSRLWFVNNRRLEYAVLGFAAKYSQRHKIKLYAFAIEGNHLHGTALFPEGNRSDFMRDLNSSVARAVPRYTNHLGGRFWGRRYSNEFLPGHDDIEEYFFYTVLQPVKDGLVSKISEYPGYNCFHDAVWNKKRKFKVVNWGKYNARLNRDPNAKISNYTEIVTLEYERLPGYEYLSQTEYAHLMMDKLEARRQIILKERSEKNLGFVGKENLSKIIPGSLPRNTKTSTKNDHRPRVLSVCPQRRAECKDWYFDIYYRYRYCSALYRAGNVNVVFPLGTYPPHLKCKLQNAS